jgi:hypothetical protein
MLGRLPVEAVSAFLLSFKASCFLVRRVATAIIGSSGHGCFAYLPLISARTDGYASFQKKGKSLVRASSFPDGDSRESDTGARLFSGPMLGVRVVPKNCCSLADAVGAPFL